MTIVDHVIHRGAVALALTAMILGGAAACDASPDEQAVPSGPTASPTASPSTTPSASPSPAGSPTETPTETPTDTPTGTPTDNLVVTVNLPSSADNTFQGKSWTVNFAFTGTQRNGTNK